MSWWERKHNECLSKSNRPKCSLKEYYDKFGTIHQKTSAHAQIAITYY